MAKISDNGSVAEIRLEHELYKYSYVIIIVYSMV